MYDRLIARLSFPPSCINFHRKLSPFANICCLLCFVNVGRAPVLECLCKSCCKRQPNVPPPPPKKKKKRKKRKKKKQKKKGKQGIIDMKKSFPPVESVAQSTDRAESGTRSRGKPKLSATERGCYQMDGWPLRAWLSEILSVESNQLVRCADSPQILRVPRSPVGRPCHV